MSLSVVEKASIRRHLGYMNTRVANSLALGLPSTSQTAFILESQMNVILPEAEDLVRRALKECDCVLDQLSRARENQTTAKVDSIEFRGREELAAHEDQYGFWVRQLSDLLGAPINPFSQVHQRINGEMFVVEVC